MVREWNLRLRRQFPWLFVRLRVQGVKSWNGYGVFVLRRVNGMSGLGSIMTSSECLLDTWLKSKSSRVVRSGYDCSCG